MKDHPRMPAPPLRTDSAVRLDGLRELTLAFLHEVDSIAGSEPLASKPSVDFYEEVRRFEVDLIRWALTRAGGNQRRAARLLNLNATTLNSLVRRHRIRPHALKMVPGS